MNEELNLTALVFGILGIIVALAIIIKKIHIIFGKQDKEWDREN